MILSHVQLSPKYERRVSCPLFLQEQTTWIVSTAVHWQVMKARAMEAKLLLYIRLCILLLEWLEMINISSYLSCSI